MIPIAHYKLNGDAADATGHGHNGTPANVTWAAGKIGQAASFNGSSGKITLPDALSAALGGCGGASVSAWVKRAGTGTNQAVLSLIIASTYTKLFLGINASNKIWAGVRSKSTELQQAVTAVDAFTDATQWHHLAATVDLAANAILIYFDGEPISTTGSPSFAQTTFSASAATGSAIGANVSSYLFNGLIDGVRIYNAPLSAWMIRELALKPSELCEPWRRLVAPTVQRLVDPMGMTIGA